MVRFRVQMGHHGCDWWPAQITRQNGDSVWRLRTPAGHRKFAWSPLSGRAASSFLLLLIMGQYFAAMNPDKQEFVCPWCIGGGAKLWEWAANPQGAIFCLLLRRSDEGGGGDFYGYRQGCGEGGAIQCPVSPIAGRWAGDRVVLVGDYDSSNLWDQRTSFRNISREVVATWNDFIGLPDQQLRHTPCDSCTPLCDTE